jgi:DNA-directed RNA polymerase specialized sigma subunit
LSKRVKRYLCHRYTGKRLEEIGEYFKVTESGVSQTSQRVAVALKKIKKLSVIVERIKQKLNLSKM